MTTRADDESGTGTGAPPPTSLTRVDADELGPRRVGGRYHDFYWDEDYTVLAIADHPVWRWVVTVEWHPRDTTRNTGQFTWHSTAWDPRDQVVRDPSDADAAAAAARHDEICDRLP
ncbi:hypothetical protein ACQP2U_43750 (plasmid) [Nocardia sp. CA-084685]|uniref:hypothetical protein n=1 Tax=Nocardia sp. CA-084685 TaxID=3239970 RepID=UPI003D95B474